MATARETIHALHVLRAAKERLVDVLPAVWPSLGILQPLGIRFRLRLECAIAIAMKAPALLEVERRSGVVYPAVMRVCRPEWFGAETSSRGRRGFRDFNS